MNIFAIIVTYNGRQVPYWYENCFTSLRESTIPVQTIVIDNASTDDTVAYIREHFPEVMLIESEKNLGFGQANNIGMRYALEHDADYVFLLNQDAWVEPDTLEKMVQIAETNPEYGILAPIWMPYEKDKLHKPFLNDMYDTTQTFLDFVEDLYFDRMQPIYSVDYAAGAAWLLPIKTLKIVGGFDPCFYHYAEDDNYMHRVHYHHLLIGVCPMCRIVHDNRIKVSQAADIVRNSKKVLMRQMCDINIKHPIKHLVFQNVKRIVKSCMKCNFYSVSLHYNELKFVLQQRDKINSSRQQNIKRGQSWL